MLLSVKNLENFNRTQPNHEREIPLAADDENPNIILKSNYYLSNNYFLNQESKRQPMYDHRWKMLQNIKSVTTLNANDVGGGDDKNHSSMRQVKDDDQMSTTSSTTTTNFTGNKSVKFIKV